MHDKRCITGLLNNSESWHLLKKKEQQFEKMEIEAIKYLFDLPLHTPTVAIIFSFGLLFTTQRIDMKQLIYLQKILREEENDNLKRSLKVLEAKNIGWYKKIVQSLQKYDLPTDFSIIASIPPKRWENTVKFVIERKNKERIMDELHKTESDVKIPKTKTKTIVDKLKDPYYTRQPESEIIHTTKNETKTIMIARYGMLECGRNFKGKMPLICATCGIKDDESHRLNVCPKWAIDATALPRQIDFNLIYEKDIDIIRPILAEINLLWNTKCSTGTMITK